MHILKLEDNLSSGSTRSGNGFTWRSPISDSLQLRHGDTFWHANGLLEPVEAEWQGTVEQSTLIQVGNCFARKEDCMRYCHALRSFSMGLHGADATLF